MNSLEDKILEIGSGKAMLKVVELLLVKGGLKKFLSGMRNGATETDIALFNLLGVRDKIDFTIEANFFKTMPPMPPKSEANARAQRATECGRFYGYPECCIEAFTHYDMPSLMFDSEFFAKPLQFVMERLYHAYTFHVPCEIECEKTRQIAGGYQNYIRTNFPKIAACFEAKYLWSREQFLARQKAVIVKPIIIKNP